MLKKLNLVSFLFTLFLGISISGYGQTFRGGFVLGGNISQIDGDQLGGFHQIGLVGGGKVDVRLSERLGLGLEMLFSQMGSDRAKFDDPFSPFDNIRLNYVEVPVSIYFRDWLIEDEAKDYYRVEAGLGLSYGRLISFKVIDYPSGEDVTDFQTYDPNLYLFHAGATYWVNSRFGVHVHWAKALNDLDEDRQVTMLSRLIAIKGYYLL